jgi:hypothetical protein
MSDVEEAAAAPALAATAQAPYAQAAAAAATCPSAQAQTVIATLNELTTAMREIANPANQISLTNVPLVLIGQGPVPPVIIGLNNAAAVASQAVAQISELKPLSGCDADAYRAYTAVSRQTLSILIGKPALSAQAPFAAAPIAAALRQVEAADDALAFALIELVSGSAGDTVKAEAASLSSTLDVAISEYSNAGS